MSPLSRQLCFLLVLPFLSSCSADDSGDIAPHSDAEIHAVLSAGLFDSKAVEVADDLVACTLSKGTNTECFSVTVHTGADLGHATGPWCPRNIKDGADQAGIWLDDGKVYDVSGEFIENLATFYEDDKWQLYNPETGEVKVTDSKAACLAAARPDVDPMYRNHCVECLPSYFDSGAGITYLIPATPQVLSDPEPIGPHTGIGLALNGVKLEAPAPLHAILGAYTIAPFDDCGGHVNPHVGYHYHAVTDCTDQIALAQSHAPLLGYAMDGFMLLTQHNTDGSSPDNLDACGGHEFAGVGYHYHAAAPGKNQILGCFNAEPGCAIEEGQTTCEHGRARP